MGLDLNQVKTANPIEQVIEETEPLRGSGKWLRGTNHDSLVVNVNAQTYTWNSRGEWGDVIEWVSRRHNTDFKGAVEYLCRRGGLEPPVWSGEDAQARVASRAKEDALTVAARHWVKAFRASTAAAEYARGRGWTDETIQRAELGYIDGDTKALRGELQMHSVDLGSPVVKAILKAPKGMLVYPHFQARRVKYFSTRSIEGKRHWNPKIEWVGERQPYYNFEYSPREERVVVVEGQADAITLAQWGVPAVALAGTYLNESLLKTLGRHKQVILALDTDRAGLENRVKAANALGPMTRILEWPEGDANAWLQAGADAGQFEELAANAATWVELVAQAAGEVDELEREKALRGVFDLVARMDDFAVSMYRDRLVDLMGIKIRQFNAMLKAAQGAKQEDSDEDDDLMVLVETPGGYVAEHLFEMIAIPPKIAGNGSGPTAQWDTKYAVRYPGGHIRVVDFLDIENVRFSPMRPESQIVTKHVVQFPYELGPERSLRELAKLVRKTIHKYVDIGPFYEHIATYYVLFTWMYDSFNTVPYLRLIGDAGTGKSRFLQVVGALCYRPTFVTGAATVSPIFRILDRYNGTLILDEGDYAHSDEAADIIKILNTGYQRIQGVVLRSGDKNTGFEPEAYSVYGPKVIATRKRFSDWALESRCLTHETGGPTTRDDIPIDLPADFWHIEAPEVRNALLRYRLENWRPEVELDYSKMDTSVEPRLNQVTVALQTLIDDPDLGDDLRQFIKEYNRQLIIERGMTLPAKVLEAVVGLEAIGQFDMAPLKMIQVKRVARATNILIDNENQQNGGDEDDEEEAKPNKKQIGPHKVGGILRKVLHLRTERMTTGTRGYGVVWDDKRVEAHKSRYGVDDEFLGHIADTLRKAFQVEPDEDPPGPLF